MFCNRPLQVVCLIVFAGVFPLVAQRFETKFETVGCKSGGACHVDENTKASLNEVGLKVGISPGPAMLLLRLRV